VGVSFVQVKHMGKRDIPADRNIQVMGFQADFALIFIKPPQEIAPDCIESGDMEGRYTIEINNIGRIK
jgi:hypothetical protein